MEGARNIKNKFITNDEDIEYYHEYKEEEEDYEIEEENNNYEKDTASIIQKELFKYTDSLPLCEYLSQQNITNFINLVSNYIEK